MTEQTAVDTAGRVEGPPREAGAAEARGAYGVPAAGKA